MTSTEIKNLVNSIALEDCYVQYQDLRARILDISFVRLVIEESPDWLGLFDREFLFIEVSLGRYKFKTEVSLQKKGPGWMRLGIGNVLPSARANLKYFLSPKKIGESIIEDWRTDRIRHFHGLNESELWADFSGGLTFLYLDEKDFDAQFMIRMTDVDAPLKVGTISRQDYIDRMDMESDLLLTPLADEEVYDRVSQCRDVITNFRPNGQIEFHLKQRLLKVVSDYLYSSRNQTPILTGISKQEIGRIQSYPLES